MKKYGTTLVIAAALSLSAAACGAQDGVPVSPGADTTVGSTDTTTTTDPTNPTDDVVEPADTAEPTDPTPSAEAQAMQDLARTALIYWSVADVEGLVSMASEEAAEHKTEMAPGTQYHDFLFGPTSWQMTAVQAWNRGPLGAVRGDEGRRAVRFYTFDDGTVAAVDLYWGSGRWLFANMVRLSQASFEAYGPRL
ncbi:MAG: hypothetical protein KC635_21675 [Myxococcales bacterium]|nr:hypothetical protein [Myxococcales bacterium]MCB9736977.1 hypothetical protein [Deltaproteobacteria bacterium]